MTPSTKDTSFYKFTLLRHAESLGNANGYHQGQFDFQLSELGKIQAKTLAQYWQNSNKQFDLIISSPLARTRQTAEILSKHLNIPMEFESLWQERDAGLLSGVHHEEANLFFKKPGFIPLYHPIGTTGESEWDLFLRAGLAVTGLLQRPFGSYLVVSHGGILNAVLYAMLGIFPQSDFKGAHFYFYNTSYATINYYPETHNWSLLQFNNPAHTGAAEWSE